MTTEGQEKPARRLVLTSAADIDPEPVVWAWEDNGHGRMPAGALTVAAGREGTGKSSFGIWLAAQITRGQLPGSFYGRPHPVIYAAVEDSWKYTIVPRLIAAEADRARVYRAEVVINEDEHGTLCLPADLSLLESAIREHGVALVVLDPLMSLIGAGIDTHRERDTRTALDPLARLADRTRCMVLGIAHFSKAAGSDASSLITGSGAFKNVPRAVFGFAVDPEDGASVVTQTKNSLGRSDLPSLAYQIREAKVETTKGVANVGRFVFIGESDRTVRDILDNTGSAEDRQERDEAANWLTRFLESKDGTAARADIMKAASAAGFSESMIKRARKKTAVRVSERQGFGGGTQWILDQLGHSQSSQLKDSNPELTGLTVTQLEPNRVEASNAACADLQDAQITKPGVETAAVIAEWCSDGTPTPDALEYRDRALDQGLSVTDLRDLHGEVKGRRMLGAAVIDEHGDDTTLGAMIVRLGHERRQAADSKVSAAA